jgi:ADP-heptose:LPS heptosyltransferase
MDKCDVLVANEGGTVHIAKALNKPTFTIFSPYVNKDHWASFEDGKFHHSVHLLEINQTYLMSLLLKNARKSRKILMHYTATYNRVSSTRIRPLLKNNIAKKSKPRFFYFF